jgi:hypothetical protein
MEDISRSLKPFTKNFVLVITALFFVLLPIFLFFGDRGWWDGDAVAQVEGVVNFKYLGPTGVYRYYWQPLAYQVSLATVHLTDQPYLLYYLPQIFGAASICVLLAALHVFTKGKLSLLLSFCILLLQPELFFSGLYYNSTVFSMLPLSIAILFLFWKDTPKSVVSFSKNPEQVWNTVRYVVIGVNAALACFFRLDFLLCLPLFAYLLLVSETQKIKSLAVFSAAVVAIFGLFFVTGLFNPTMILGILGEHNHVVDEWSAEYATPIWKGKVAFTLMSLVIWPILLAYTVYFFVNGLLKKNWLALLMIVPIAILLYPLSTLVSPKYLVPGVIFLPFVFATMLLQLQHRLGQSTFKKISYGLIALTVFLQLLSIQPSSKFPFIAITPEPMFLGTHDGPRAVGAYIRGYNRVREVAANEEDVEGINIIKKAASKISTSNQNADFIIRKESENGGDRNWGWLSLDLQIEGYNITEFTNTKIALERNNQIVSIERVGNSRFTDLSNDKEKVVIRSQDMILLQ